MGAGYAFSLETIYEHGLFELQEQGGARSEARIGRYYNYLFKDAGTIEGATDWVRLGFHTGGAGFTWFLALMRQYFLRWPLHPMGFVFGTGFGWLVWGSVFCGWLCKWLAVRYGGCLRPRGAHTGPFRSDLQHGRGKFVYSCSAWTGRTPGVVRLGVSVFSHPGS